MYTVNLIRERVSEGEAWVDTFKVEDFVVNPEVAIRNAVKEFLATAQGKSAVAETNADFNWGDATLFVPNEIWAKHGICYQFERSFDIRVNHDELLTQ